MATVEELARQLNEYIARNEQYVATEFRGAATELEAFRQRVAFLEEASRDAIGVVRNRVAVLEENSRGHGQGDGGGKGRSLIYATMMTPSVLVQTEHWKKWKGDREEYCENIHGDMKDIMEQARKAEDDIEESWFNDTDDCW